MKKNTRIKKLIEKTSEKDEKIWKDIARRLSKPRRNMAEVNINKIKRFAKEKETIVVPGKVLGYGNLDKKVEIAAFSFSKTAEEKIKKKGGNCIKIEDFLKNKPKGVKVRLMG